MNIYWSAVSGYIRHEIFILKESITPIQDKEIISKPQPKKRGNTLNKIVGMVRSKERKGQVAAIRLKKHLEQKRLRQR